LTTHDRISQPVRRLQGAASFPYIADDMGDMENTNMRSVSAAQYRRLRSRDRQVLHVTELDAGDIDAVAEADVPGEYAHLDAEIEK